MVLIPSWILDMSASPSKFDALAAWGIVRGLVTSTEAEKIHARGRKATYWENHCHVLLELIRSRDEDSTTKLFDWQLEAKALGVSEFADWCVWRSIRRGATTAKELREAAQDWREALARLAEKGIVSYTQKGNRVFNITLCQ